MWFHRVKKVFHEPAGFVRQPSRPRKAVGAAFSSVSVLNASFRRSGKGIPLGSSAESSGVDLLKVTLRPEDGENMGLTVVQNVHEMSMILCWNTPNLDDILWWFLPTSVFFGFSPGEKSLQHLGLWVEQRRVGEHLGSRHGLHLRWTHEHKIPTDDPETLCVFLVVFGMHKWIGHLKNPGLRCLEVKNSWEHHRTIDGWFSMARFDCQRVSLFFSYAFQEKRTKLLQNWWICH